MARTNHAPAEDNGDKVAAEGASDETPAEGWKRDKNICDNPVEIEVGDAGSPHESTATEWVAQAAAMTIDTFLLEKDGRLHVGEQRLSDGDSRGQKMVK